eukprot:TRINITY_DN752_c0_g1_i1.p1 TRINITY_DN752_c0_g1~~TRINITY_DN752_c0_g1_i1.p1  ORF type:complete len:109 (+),score=36.93 TRINITY_DN752_c0_g1_i1:321-647(+)
MPATFTSCPTFNGINGTNGLSDSVETSSVSSDEDGIIIKPHKKVLTPEMVNEGIKIMSYAVRGPLMIRANELEKEVAEGVKKPFSNVIKANIGDAHAMGNSPSHSLDK